VASTQDDEREDRRWLWLAIPGSVVLHALVVLALPDHHARSNALVRAVRDDVWLDAPTGALGARGTEDPHEVAAGAPGAPSDEADAPPVRSSTTRREVASSRESDATSAEPGEATSDPNGAESSEATSDPNGAESSEANGADGAGGLSNDAFLDGLLARGDGAGGGGGDGCADPVVGTWRARRYDEEGTGPDRLGHHASFTIRITSHEGERLEGAITLRAWSGDASETSPPRCRTGHYDHTVRMRATGSLEGDRFRMDALDHVRTEHCIDFGRWSYNLDHFRGRLDGESLDLVNNDGGREVNAPYRFRRVSCR
jgi:hypothetical protein